MTVTKTITVYGANGKVGGEFVNMALAAGYSIRAFVRNRESFARTDTLHVVVIEGDE